MWIFISVCLAAIPYVANGVTSAKLTGDWEDSILEDFNAARQAINTCSAKGKNGNLPSPKNALPDLIWDSDLAETARAKAATCQSWHSKWAPSGGWGGLKDGNGNKPGEIITSSTYSTTTLNHLITVQAPSQYINAERNRYKLGKYGKNTVDGNFNCWKDNQWQKEDAAAGNCGHYTQIIWEQSTHVGCGYATGCGSNGGKKILVCHLQGYGNPLGSGNYVGAFPYTEGTYCSAIDSNDGSIWLDFGYEDEDAANDSTQHNSSRNVVVGVAVGLVVLFCCVMGGAGVWFYRRRKSAKGKVEFNDDIGIDDNDEDEDGKETRDGDEETAEVEEVEVEVEMELNTETRE